MTTLKRFHILPGVLACCFFLGTLTAIARPHAAPPDCTTGLAGTVFIDYNSNGIRDLNETEGQPNVIINVTDSGGQSFSTVTDGAGRYMFDQSLTYPVRIVFGDLPLGLQPTLRGDNNQTCLQFVIKPGCGHDLSANLPQDYCQSNPYVVTSCFVGAELPAAGAMIRFRASSVSTPAQPFNNPAGSQFAHAPLMPETMLANQQQLGSVHGLAWHRSSQAVLTSAFARIEAQLPGGLGAIYKLTNVMSATPTVSTLLTVANVGSGSVTAGDVGKKGLGNLELSADQQTLYTINLNTRSLVTIPLNGSALTPGPITETLIPAPADCPTDYRPFAVRQHNGKLYIGITCGSADAAQLKAYVYEFDGSTFTLRLTVPFTYARASVNVNYYGLPGSPTYIDNNMGFVGWNTFPAVNTFAFGDAAKTQPWLTDIAFDRNDIILGIRSRLADATLNGYWAIGGDVLRACANGTGGWSLESNGVCGGKTTGTPPVTNPFTGAANLRDNSKGPGGYEYYWGDDGFEGEAAQGSLLQIPGNPQVFVTQTNALGHNGQIGIMALDNSTGQTTAGGNVFYGDYNTGNNIAKANGLGALAALCDAAPVQFGNRVWIDKNQNGYQDVNEPAVPGVTVTLFDQTGQTPIATNVTNADGEFYFSSTPMATMGTDTPALLPNTGFVLAITSLGNNAVVTDNGLILSGVSPLTPGVTTTINPGTTSLNNDAMLLNGRPTIRFQSGGLGSVNHTYDFGLVSACVPACLPITAKRLY